MHRRYQYQPQKLRRVSNNTNKTPLVANKKFMPEECDYGSTYVKAVLCICMTHVIL
jgi:hypothetical protein